MYQLVELGSLALTLPLAAAIGAMLLAWRAWRAALAWMVLFGLAVGLVGASKIAFMGWGTGWQDVCFKALSGHAAGVSAVYPTLFSLFLHASRVRTAQAGMGLGLVLGSLVALLLVTSREHSAAEAIAGWCMGTAASLLFMRLAGALPPPRPLIGTLVFGATFAAVAWSMQWAHIGWWMIKLARLLSGKQTLFAL